MTFWLSNVISLMVGLPPLASNAATSKADLLTLPGHQLYLPVSWHKVDGSTNGMMTRRRATGADLGPHARRRSFQAGSAGKEDHKAHDDLDGDASQLMTQHSMEHRTLVTLLRERGTILENERVPEDALFYDDAIRDDRRAPSTNTTTPKETRIGRYDHNDFDEETGFGSTPPTETSTVPYGFSSPSVPSTSAAKRTSSYSEKIFGSKLPSAVSRTVPSLTRPRTDRRCLPDPDHEVRWTVRRSPGRAIRASRGRHPGLQGGGSDSRSSRTPSSYRFVPSRQDLKWMDVDMLG
jgi:hypothetical protein